MNQNNDRENTSKNPANAQSGDRTNTNLNANAGNPGQPQPRTQNQPQNQNLQPQQQQHQSLKPNQAPGADLGNQPVPGKEDRAGNAQVGNQQGAQGTSNRQDQSGRAQTGNPSEAKDASARQGAQGKSDASGHSDAECQEAKKKMEEAGKPGANHKALEPMIGNWKAEVKCWKPDGSGEPHTSQGTAKTMWILQGRFLQEDFSGEMMGQPFKGLTLLGYDNVKQAYSLVWLADTQTSIFTSEGKGDSGNKVITLEGEANCPINGPQQVKSVYRLLDQNKHVFEMHNGGKKTLEVTYTRQ